MSARGRNVERARLKRGLRTVVLCQDLGSPDFEATAGLKPQTPAAQAQAGLTIAPSVSQTAASEPKNRSVAKLFELLLWFLWRAMPDSKRRGLELREQNGCGAKNDLSWRGMLL